MYIETNTQRYPVSEHEVQQAFPGLIFPPDGIPDEYLNGTGFARVSVTEQPQQSHPRDQIQEAAPALIGGEWVQQWTVIAYDGPNEAEIEARRQARDAAVAALKAGPAPATLPQLIARVDLIETMLGLK